MSKPKPYDVRVTMSIKKSDSYEPPVARFSSDEQVPPGEDPVAYLRNLARKGFQKHFADLELPSTDEEI